MSTEHVLEAIDGALTDWATSKDAMRWAPEPDEVDDPDALTWPTAVSWSGVAPEVGPEGATLNCAAGMHDWIYGFDASGEEITAAAECIHCRFVESWELHMAREPQTMAEASGRLAAAARMLWLQTGAPEQLQRLAARLGRICARH